MFGKGLLIGVGGGVLLCAPCIWFSHACLKGYFETETPVRDLLKLAYAVHKNDKKNK